MKRLLLILLSQWFLSSCALQKLDGKVITETDSDHPHYVLQDPYIQIELKGDYYFHPLKQKYFLGGNEHFLKYITKRVANHQPKLMFAAHTFVPPYYSAVAILYKNARIDSVFKHKVIQQLKDEMHVSRNIVEAISTSFGRSTKIEYSAADRTTKIMLWYTEYLIDKGNQVVRLCFWTTDGTESIIDEEIEGIVKTIKFEKS